MKRYLMLALLLTGCGDSGGPSNAWNSSAPCANSPLTNTWKFANGNTLLITADCKLADDYCALQGSVTPTTANSGTVSVDITYSVGGPTCIASGKHTCSYNITPGPTLAFNCN